MRVLISTVGSHGDVHPFLAIGAALRRRGHQVAMVVQPYFRPQVLDAGIEHVPAGEEHDMRILADHPAAMSAWRGSAVVFRRFVFPHAPLEFAAVRDEIDRNRPDIVLAHQISLGGIWAARQRGVPVAVASLSPVIWFSHHDQAVILPLLIHDPGPRLMRFQRWAARVGMRRLYDGLLNRARRDLGLSTGHDWFISEARGGIVNLGLWSPHFRPPFPDDLANTRICGFAWHDRAGLQEHAPDQIERFLAEGDPPIVFTLGSTAVHVAGRFYDAAAGACRLLGRRGLLLTGRPEYAPTHLPPGVRAFTYAPHSVVMPRGCATVHHGGVGTTAQALRSGRPTVIMPFAHDQFDNAARAKRLGVSESLKRSRVSAQSLAVALRAILDNPAPRRRAEALARSMASEDGATAVAISLEQAIV